MFPNLWRWVQGPAGCRRSRLRRRFRPELLPLEERLAPAILPVTTTDDNGKNDDPTPGSLREAILLSNASAGVQDLINFDIGDGVQLIVPTIPLPAITDSVILDGSAPLGEHPTQKIVLSGSLSGLFADVPAGTNGLTITADHCTIQQLNIVFFNTGSGILITGPGATDNVVWGCAIGSTTPFLDPVPNLNGVTIADGASNNTIGGFATGYANLISGNLANGIQISGDGTTGNVVENNYIGLSADGKAAQPNGLNGVLITGGASNNRVGETLTGFGNVIGGNEVSGVQISGAGTKGNVVVNNSIGLVKASGMETVIGNGLAGVLIAGGASENTIGGTAAFAANVISGNHFDGVVIQDAGTKGNTVAGNLIGMNKGNSVLVLGGHAVPNGGNGVLIRGGASNTTIGGANSLAGNCISGNLGNGVLIQDGGTSGNTVAGNLIGTDLLGLSALANGHNGVQISNGATNNTIGGSTTASRNLIAGNGEIGVLIQDGGTLGNTVAGNYIGTNADGTSDLPNKYGVQINTQATHNTVGGTAPGARNVISGNTFTGVLIQDIGTKDNTVVGNFIGTKANGFFKLPNGGSGVALLNGATFNTIGGPGDGARNVISGNTHNGVAIGEPGTAENTVAGNFIGTRADGAVALPNGDDGVLLDDGASDNLIGGTAPETGNVLAGNSGNGVQIKGAGTTLNTVAGNFIGINAFGTVALPNGVNGVLLDGGTSFNTVGGNEAGSRNVISGNTGDGVVIQDPLTSFNTVAGNFIGINFLGTAQLPNEDGVVIKAFATHNTIGGTDAPSRNVLSGNHIYGVQITGLGTSENTVAGNFIGTDKDGTAGVANEFGGVHINAAASSNTVGGTAAGARNVISGNLGGGVFLGDVSTSFNTVAGNFIGTNAAGTDILPNFGDGVDIVDGAGMNTVGGTTAGARNVISGNASSGVKISGNAPDGTRTADNVVAGNYIGTNAAGTAALGNDHGVELSSGTGDNTIGGTTAGSRNVISGNASDGVLISDAFTSGNTVAGNFIGTNKDGTAAVANGADGVLLKDGATMNSIGGSTAASRNVLSGNSLSGVGIVGAATTHNKVAGNYIGTNAAGTAALGNGPLDFPSPGVFLSADDNTIGGLEPGAGNVISANRGDGVTILGNGNTLTGNFIGTDKDGSALLGNSGDGVRFSFDAGSNTIGGTFPSSGNVIAGNSKGVTTTPKGFFGGAAGTGNRILGNSIFANTGLGIDLGSDGVTANDPGDADTGPNNLQNFPVLIAVSGTTVVGRLNSQSGNAYRLEFFSSPADPTGQGRTFLGFLNVSTDISGNTFFKAPVAAIPAGEVVTATATDLATGDTSEFSPPPIGVTVSATAGSGQSAKVTTVFATPLQATVKDNEGHPVAGVDVVFTAPAAAGAFADGNTTVTVPTDGEGVATAPAFTAGPEPGGPFSVTATFGGQTASFSLTSVAPPSPTPTPSPSPALTPASTPSTSTPALTAASPVTLGVTDVTSQVTVVVGRAHFNRATRTTRLRVQLHNGGSTLLGPVSFVLDGLTRGVRLRHAAGRTVGLAPLSSPFADVPLGPSNLIEVSPAVAPGPFTSLTSQGGADGQFVAGETRFLDLTLANPTGGRIRFHFRILAGAGTR
jgi:hypothetical protein